MARIPSINARVGAVTMCRRLGLSSPRGRWRSIVFATAALAPLSAAACTLCHSDLAREVRQQVFGPEFLANALAVFAPLPVLIACIYLAARDSPSEYRRR
jgi:hypothetical protein